MSQGMQAMFEVEKTRPAAEGWLRRRRRHSPLRWAAGVIAALFAMPVAAVAVQLFLPGGGSWPHLVATVLPDYVANTLLLVLGAGIGVVAVGTGAAWLVTMCRFPGRGLLEWALVLPLAVPAYVLAYTYTDFLDVSGPLQTLLREATGWSPRDYWFPEVRSLGGAIAMFVFALYPYVYLLARAAFVEQSVCVIEVARTLGAGPWETFRRIALPLARPAVAAGTALALMETVSDFGTVAYFGVPTFTTGIYRAWFSMGDRVAAAQLSTVLLGFVLLILALERLTRGQARFHQTTGKYRALPSYGLRGAKAWLASAACVLPLLLGFLLPGAILLRMALFYGDAQWGSRYVQLALNSATLSAVAALLAVLLSLLLAYAARREPGLLTRAAVQMAGLGYAVPGSVIAVGILIPFTAFDNGLDAWSRQTFGLPTGLLLTGTIAGLVVAYLVRFLAVSLQAVHAGLAKVTPSLDAAAHSLGAGTLGAMLRVHAPLMAGSLMTAGLIVFVETMKELPATLLLRPFNFDTLAVQAYHLAQDERLAEASTAALTIVAVSLLPVISLSRAIARSRPGQGGAADRSRAGAPPDGGAPSIPAREDKGYFQPARS